MAEFCVRTILAKVVVDEAEVLIGHVDAISVQPLVDFDEVHTAHGHKLLHFVERGCGGGARGGQHAGAHHPRLTCDTAHQGG